MKKKKYKSKSITCPHGGTFAKDWFQFNKCTSKKNPCRFAKECKAAESENFEAGLYEEDEEKQKSKSPKKTIEINDDDIVDDQRGNYTTREDTKILLFGTNKFCILVFHYLMFKSYSMIDKRPHLTLDEMAAELPISRTTVYKAITILIKKGLLRRTKQPYDTDTGQFGETYIYLDYKKRPTKYIIENAEYLKVIDELVEEGFFYIKAFTKERTAHEVLKWKYKKLKDRYKKLKKGITVL